MDHRAVRTRALLATALAVLGLVAAASLGPALATHQPANKISVSGSTVELMSTDFSPLAAGQTSEVVQLLSSTMRTSGAVDLLFRATLECALWTDITTVGNDEARAYASVKAWVEVDGQAVAVDGDDGKVVFCNRDYHRVTSMFDDENATIEDYLRTRSANAFNWFAFNVGPGFHTITLMAQLETEVEGTGNAVAAVGKRTLIVEPEFLADHL